MAVTLEWVRDHYDTINKDRLIEHDEAILSVKDFLNKIIDKEQLDSVQLAYNQQTLLPAYTTPLPPSVTLTWVRDNYDVNKNRLINFDEAIKSTQDYSNNAISKEQLDAVQDAYNSQTLLPAYDTPTPVCTPGETGCLGSSTRKVCKSDGSGWDYTMCPSGYECQNGECVLTSPIPPPNMETRTVSLTEGTHTIQVSLNGYDTLNATIDVTATGVTCVSVIGGACGGTGLPRVSTSGLTVSTYLKSATTATTKCTWIATQNTSAVSFISDMVLAYNNLKNIGFTPSAAEIGNGVLMYSNLGTPASLWGC